MRTLAIGCALSLIAAASAFAQFEETITVSRVLVDVRVTDSRGVPLRGLTPDDFTVKIGDAPSRVQSVTFIDEATNWIDETSSPLPDDPATSNRTLSAAAFSSSSSKPTSPATPRASPDRCTSTATRSTSSNRSCPMTA